MVTRPSWSTSKVVEFSSMSGWWWLLHGLAIKALPQCRGERSMKPDPPQCHGEPHTPMSRWRTLANALVAKNCTQQLKLLRKITFAAKKTKYCAKELFVATQHYAIPVVLFAIIWIQLFWFRENPLSFGESDQCRLLLIITSLIHLLLWIVQ